MKDALKHVKTISLVFYLIGFVCGAGAVLLCVVLLRVPK
jgi:hypothetical protein